jgi:hypothetical protein
MGKLILTIENIPTVDSAISILEPLYPNTIRSFNETSAK